MDRSTDSAVDTTKETNETASSEQLEPTTSVSTQDQPSTHLDDASLTGIGSPLALDDLQGPRLTEDVPDPSIVHMFDAQHTSESIVDSDEVVDWNRSASAGAFGEHVNQAKSIIRDLRAKLQCSKQQVNDASLDSYDQSTEFGADVDPEEEGLADLLQDQRLLKSKLRAAKDSQGNDEIQLKTALSSALEASRMQNRDLRENLASLNHTLTAEIARRTKAENELAEAVRTIETLKRTQLADSNAEQQVLIEKLLRAEEECASLRAQLDAKLLNGSTQTPLDPILQIRAEISQLQETRAAELNHQVQQLEEEVVMLENLATELRVQLLEAQTDRDLAKDEVTRLLTERVSETMDYMRFFLASPLFPW